MAANAEASTSTSASTSAPQPDASGRVATPMNRNNPAFLNKLRTMLDDKNNEDMIKWAPDGKSFFVPNHIKFGDTLLPRFFKHRNFSSFVRQLNMYGFHKVPHLQQGALDSEQAAQSELWQFTNELFTRDQPELTAQVQRKKGTKHGSSSGSNANSNHAADAGFAGLRPNQLLLTDMPFTAAGDGSQPGLPPNASFDGTTAQNLHLHPLFPALQAITVAQTNINSEMSRLRSSNDDLWREAIDTRQRLKKQQDTVNKVIRFLAGVFGGRALANVASDEEGGGLTRPTSPGTAPGNADASTSSSHMDASGAGSSSSAALNNARRVAVYRPGVSATGRLMIEGAQPNSALGGPSSGQQEGRAGGIVSITPLADQGVDRQAEIFELPEVEELDTDGASRFVEAVSPSDTPPDRSPDKSKSPSLHPQDARRSKSTSSTASGRRTAKSRTPALASVDEGAGPLIDTESAAATNWLAALLGQGASPAGDGSSSGALAAAGGGGAGAGLGLGLGGAGLSATATQLDPSAMAALQSLFNSTSNSPLRSSFAAAGAPASGSLAGASSMPAMPPPLPMSSALTLPTTSLASGALDAAGELWPPHSSSSTTTATTSGAGAGAGSSSNAIVLPSGGHPLFPVPADPSASLSSSSALNGLALSTRTSAPSPTSQLMTAAAAAAAATAADQQHPELVRHTGELAQSHEDMQRVNAYLQALIDGIMQAPSSSAAGTGTGTADGSGVDGGGGGVGMGSGGTPLPTSGMGAGAGAGASATTPMDLDALLQEFLVPAAAATPQGQGPPPGPGQGQPLSRRPSLQGQQAQAPVPGPPTSLVGGANGLHLPSGDVGGQAGAGPASTGGHGGQDDDEDEEEEEEEEASESPLWAGEEDDAQENAEAGPGTGAGEEGGGDAADGANPPTTSTSTGTTGTEGAGAASRKRKSGAALDAVGVDASSTSSTAAAAAAATASTKRARIKTESS